MIFSAIESKTYDRRLAYEIEILGVKHCLTIGAASYSGEITLAVFPNTWRTAHLLLGRFSSLGEEITFLTGANHNYKNVSTFPFDVSNIVKDIFGDGKSLPHKRPNHHQVIIGHDVWIGYGATILGGVKIGNGAVVGAQSVIAKDVPPYAIVAGNPARIIKYRFDEATIKKFLAVKWWNWDLQKIKDNLPLMSDVEKFLERHWSTNTPPRVISSGNRSKTFVRKVSTFTISLRTFAQFSRCGFGLLRAFVNHVMKTPCSSFGLTKIRRRRTSTRSTRR